MIPVSTVIACIITLFVSLILPVVCLIVYAVRHKGDGIWSAWFLGAAGFFIPQMLIRLPLLNLLSSTNGFLVFAQSRPFLYSLSLAFTAGLFELAGRFAAAGCMKKRLTFQRSLAAGMGHGGIEAIVVVGLTYINNLIYIVMIRSGSFDALIAQTTAAGVDASQLEAIRQALVNTSAGLFLAAGLERILTMISHAAMSVIVCCGVASGHTFKGLLLCLAMHTLLDTSAGIRYLAGGVISQTAAYCIIYAILAVFALVSVWILKYIRANWMSAVREETAQ